MKIILRKSVRKVLRSSGVRYYYDFPEYALHLNELKPHGATDWHHHEKIWETVFIIKGKITVKWKEDGIVRSQVVAQGDVIEVSDAPQSFANETDEIATFLDIKQVLSGEDKQNLIKNDKVLDE